MRKDAFELPTLVTVNMKMKPVVIKVTLRTSNPNLHFSCFLKVKMYMLEIEIIFYLQKIRIYILI